MQKGDFIVDYCSGGIYASASYIDHMLGLRPGTTTEPQIGTFDVDGKFVLVTDTAVQEAIKNAIGLTF